jgi:DNA repair protein SbcD/Mre11
MKLKFIHTADLHLDTPFRGLTGWNPLLAEKLKDATYKSLGNIVDLCIVEKVDFLLVAGDIFDCDCGSLAAQLRFLKELKRLSDIGIAVYFICGNHDHLGSWDMKLTLPPGVYRFGSEKVERMTYSRDGVKLADIYGISYQTNHVTVNLVPKYLIGEDPAPLSIAMLHGMADIVGPDKNYAPFSVNDLHDQPFDYWALGHVHKAGRLNQDPPMVYPGNPQGRDFGETGQKGCVLVEVNGGKPELRFIPVQHLRFEEIKVDLTGHDNIMVLEELIDDAKSKISASDRNISLILRITLTGRTDLHGRLSRPGEVMQLVSMLNEGQLERDVFTWTDSIAIKTRPVVNIDQLRGGSDFTAGIINHIERYEEDGELLSRIIDRLIDELPAARVFREVRGLADDEKKDVLEEAKWMLIDSLLQDTDRDDTPEPL